MSVESLSIPCPHHPSLNVQRIDPALLAKKNLYCYECMLQTDDGSALYKSLPNIPTFLDLTANAFAKDKNNIKPTSDVPPKYKEAIARETETIEKLRNHLKQEKKRVEHRFDEIAQALQEVVQQTKNEYLKLLDEQEINLFNNYASFVKELESGYPKKEDIDMWFPTRQELDRRITQIRSSVDLEDFVKDIKKNLHDNKLGIIINRQTEANRVQYFDELVKNLKRIETLTPVLDAKIFNVQTLKDTMKRELDKYLSTALTLKDPILSTISDYQSTIVSDHDFAKLREWLPKQYVLNFKLLYRGSRDGMSPETFHTRCDGKGATVTLIKCRFEGALEPSVIGGFLDKDWHNKNATIASNDAFLFSLIHQLKFPVSKPVSAANGYTDYGPTFGAGSDIRVARDLTQCYVNPHSFTDSAKLVDSDTYQGSGIIYFTPIDVEVYALKA